MTESQGPKPTDIDGYDLAAKANSLDPHLASAFRRWLSALRPPRNPFHHIVDGRERIDPVAFARNFKKATHFKEIDADLVVTEDPVGLIRIVDGQEETYMDKLAKERARGQNEAASYGIGNLGKNKFVEIIFNWDFLAATSGAVVGEKFMRAMELATEKNLPVVVLYSSGGQRQQEAAGALIEMLRTSYAIDEFKKKTNQPLISVLVGNVWGGISASAVTKGDLVIGMAGTDFGFAGPSVIKAAEGDPPPQGSQTVENSFLTNRNVQMVLNTQGELLEVISKTLSIHNEEPKKLEVKKMRETTAIEFDGYGFRTPFKGKSLRTHQRARISLPSEPIDPKTVYEQHLVLRSDPRRPDTLYLLKHTFDGYIPFFTGDTLEDEVGKQLKYPAIVSALAYIDDPRLSRRLKMMIIGNQPSYVRLENGAIMKDHANPTAWDYHYLLKMVEFAKRFGYQITTFTDTFGAKPSLKDELEGQYDAISDSLTAQLTYPYFTRGYIIGVLGSGGGLATTFRNDYVAQLSGAQEFVAEPNSAAAIIYRGPTQEDIVRTAEGMRPTAEFSLSRGLIDNIIPEPPGGAQNHPLSTALSIREDIILTELEHGGLTTEEILERRGQRMKNLRPIPIGHLDPSSGSRHIRLPFSH